MYAIIGVAYYYAHKRLHLKSLTMVPTWTGKMGKLFPVREKSGHFEQTGKVREFHPKYWKSEGILASFYFYFFSDFLIEVLYLLDFVFVKFIILKHWWKNTGKVSSS